MWGPKSTLHANDWSGIQAPVTFWARYTECFTCMSAFNTVVSPMNRQTCSCACSKACACATCPFHVQCKPKIRSEKVLLLPALPLLTRPAYLACLRGLSNSSCTLRKLKDWPNDDLGSHFLEPESFQTKIFGCLLWSSFTFNSCLGMSWKQPAAALNSNLKRYHQRWS